MLWHCTLWGNSAAAGGNRYGGATFYSTLFNCTVISNTALFVGGVYGGTASNCHLMRNTGTYGGGTGGGAILYNALLYRNNAGWQGGGANAATLYNCTIVSNTSSDLGGGCYGGSRYNCISWDNNKPDYGSSYYFCCGVGLTNNASITNDPLFADSANINYRLSPASPCLNTGSNQAWMANAVDLDGNRRIAVLGGTVDMGAFEYPLRGTFFRGR